MYLSFESGDENPVFKGIQEHDTVMTFMEATADEIHSSLDDTINGQTHYRLVGFILRSIFSKISVPILFIAFLMWWKIATNSVTLSYIYSKKHTEGVSLKSWVNEYFGGQWCKRSWFSLLVCRKCSFYEISSTNREWKNRFLLGNHATPMEDCSYCFLK